ncbi:MAG: hypothetical protein ACI901_000189 [Octadecabacter sp.]|jgi:hypothetical protein
MRKIFGGFIFCSDDLVRFAWLEGMQQTAENLDMLNLYDQIK